MSNSTHRFTPKIRSLSFLIAATFSTTSMASGLFLQEAVVANAGTTGAGDGVYTESAAAMWANPATMSHMGESMTTVNALAFDLKMDFDDKLGSGDGSAQSYLPSVAVFHTRQLNDDVHFGVAFGAAGGSSLTYGTNWAGANTLDSITLNVLQINPSLSFKVNDQWSWGMGAQFSWGSLEQDTEALSIQQDADWAYGFNMGVMYRHSDNLDVGFSFRSRLEHEFSADVKNRTDIEELNLLNQVSTDINVPAIADISVRYGLTEDLNLLTSVQLHRWSEWDSTVLDFGLLPNRTPIEINRDWDDVWKLAVAADYRLNSDWRLKTGISYESSPQDDAKKQWADLPVGEQWRYSVGASTKWNATTIDFFYEYADLGSVDINRANIGQVGTFDGRIHFVGINATF
ncbi:OmpP1/FadL family transporter [Vibrio maerlii]|uniref:OmpP1/FadL family transporter n=1 Tax=Vibrio maerlii TaxID=2231648 RepID=UPI0019D2FBEB|nr:outer membrane protein transport protein [Vibrio maerlii]